MQKKIRLKLYECTILLVISSKFAKDAKRKEKVYNAEPEDYNDDEEGVTMGDAKEYCVIMNHKFLTHNAIAHEMYHLTRRIGGDRNITDDEESLAWLCGYVTDELYKLVDKWTLKKDSSPAPASSPPSPTTSPTITEKSGSTQ